MECHESVKIYPNKQIKHTLKTPNPPVQGCDVELRYVQIKGDHSVFNLRMTASAVVAITSSVSYFSLTVFAQTDSQKTSVPGDR